MSGKANSRVKQSLFMKLKCGHNSLPENKGHKNKSRKRIELVQDKTRETQEKRLLDGSICDIECLFACTGAREKTSLFRLQMKVKQGN